MHICFIIDNNPQSKQQYNVNTSSSFTIPSAAGSNIGNSVNNPYNINMNISMLDIIKISVQTILNQLHKKSILKLQQPQQHNLHLHITSKPNEPLSTFQHNFTHFLYQLKEIRSSEQPTYPGETILQAIRNVSRFRLMHKVESVCGYRWAHPFEPVIFVFLGFGMTMRKICSVDAFEIYKLMRSEYKFINFRLCYPIQSQKDKGLSLDKYKIQIQNMPENKKMLQILQKLNEGQNKNIIKFAGQDSLVDVLMKALTNFRSSLHCGLLFDSQVKIGGGNNYFKSSGLNAKNFSTNIFKAQIMPDDNNRLFLPIPQQLTLKDTPLTQLQSSINSNSNTLILNFIQQVHNITFHIDLSKQLSLPNNTNNSIVNVGTFDTIVPFDKFAVLKNSSQLLKLHKELERCRKNFVYFPVYVCCGSVVSNNAGNGNISNNTNNNISSINSTQNAKNSKSYYLIGLLKYTSNFFQLMLSFPNFSTLQWLLTILTSIKTSSPNYQSQIINIGNQISQYRNTVPQFYLQHIDTFLSKFIQSLQQQPGNLQPSLYKSLFHRINLNTNNNGSNLSNAYKSMLQRQYRIKNIIMRSYNNMNILRVENVAKHENFRAECCPAYDTVENYRKYCRDISMQWNHKQEYTNRSSSKNNTNTNSNTEYQYYKSLINNISQISSSPALSTSPSTIFPALQSKQKTNSYFSQAIAQSSIRQSSMVRQLNRYNKNSVSQDINLVNNLSAFDNGSINNIDNDNQNNDVLIDMTRKRVKLASQQQQQQRQKTNKQHTNWNNFQLDSIMPQKQLQQCQQHTQQFEQQDEQNAKYIQKLQKQQKIIEIQQEQAQKQIDYIQLNQNPYLNLNPYHHQMHPSSYLENPNSMTIQQIYKQSINNNNSNNQIITQQLSKQQQPGSFTNYPNYNNYTNFQQQYQKSLLNIIKKSSSIDYNDVDSQHNIDRYTTNQDSSSIKNNSNLLKVESKREIGKKQNRRKISLIKYLDSLQLDNSVNVKMKAEAIAVSGDKECMFEENIRKLSKIGLVKQIGKYISNNNNQ